MSQRMMEHHHDMEFDVLMDNIPGGVHQCANDAMLTLLHMSGGFFELFGYSKEEIANNFNNCFMNMIYENDKADVAEAIHDQLSRGDDIELDYRVLCKGGRLIWIFDKGRLVTASDSTQSFYCVLVEVTARKKEQETLRLSLERHKIIMDQATDIIFEWDIWKDRMTYSPNWKKKFGYSPVKNNISLDLPKSDNIHRDDMPMFVKIMKDTAAGVPYSETEFRIKNVMGVYVWCRIRATTQFSRDGLPIKAVGVILDIDNERKQRDFLLEQAQKDALTGLYNKSSVNALVEEHLHSSWEQGANALMIIDIDDFKLINDTFGHLCGDAVLSDIAITLKNLFRASDVVGRIGGDEFLVFLPEVKDMEAVEKKAIEILVAVSKISPAPTATPVSCSIGAFFSVRGGGDYYGLCRCADRALYHVKNSGRGGFAFYDPRFCDDAVPCGKATSAIGEVIDSERINDVDEQLAQYAFRMLYSSLDIEPAIHQILEIVGRAYDVSRVYIFESSDDGKFCSNTFEWCGDGIEPMRENLQNISYEKDLGGYFDNFDENGVFYCKDISTLHPALYSILEPQGISAMLQCVIQDSGRFLGYVGFDECRASRYWTKEQVTSLTLFARVLSTFLIKLRLHNKLELLK